MSPYLESVIDVLLDRSPQEWIEGLIFAMFLAFAMVGVHVAIRRWTKFQGDTASLAGLATVAIFVGMLITAVGSELKRKRAVDVGPAVDARAPGGPFRGPG